MKKHLLQIVGLVCSLMSYLYFVIILDTSFIGGKSEYERFFLDELKFPFQIVTTTFITLVNNHYYIILLGQGG